MSMYYIWLPLDITGKIPLPESFFFQTKKSTVRELRAHSSTCFGSSLPRSLSAVSIKAKKHYKEDRQRELTLQDISKLRLTDTVNRLINSPEA